MCGTDAQIELHADNGQERPDGTEQQRGAGEMMYVYMGKSLIVIETNIAWAVPYWTERRAVNKKLNWEVK